jgi:hypothetical protein
MNLCKIGVVLLALLLAAMAMVPMVSAGEQTMSVDNFSLAVLKPNDAQQGVVIQNGFSISTGDNARVIPVGSIIQHSENGITRVFDSEGKQLLLSKDSDSPKVLTPAGYVSAVDVNQIPDGSYVQENTNGITHVYLNDKRILTIISSNKTSQKNVPVPSTNGWVEESFARGIPQLGQFIADWNVPSSPPNKTTGAVDFLFNAIQPSDNSGIVQPVLEYNHEGTHQWTGAAWYGDRNGQYYRSNPFTTAVGHTIRGTLGWNTKLNRWNIIVQDLNTGGSTSNFSTNAPNIGTNNVQAFCALEGWYINNDNDISGKTTFTNMRFRDVNLNPVSFSWNKYVSTNMGLTNLDVTWSGMTPVTLWTKNL